MRHLSRFFAMKCYETAELDSNSDFRILSLWTLHCFLRSEGCERHDSERRPTYTVRAVSERRRSRQSPRSMSCSLDGDNPKFSEAGARLFYCAPIVGRKSREAESRYSGQHHAVISNQGYPTDSQDKVNANTCCGIVRCDSLQQRKCNGAEDTRSDEFGSEMRFRTAVLGNCGFLRCLVVSHILGGKCASLKPSTLDNIFVLRH